MIVCVCYNVSEKAIAQVAATGVTTMTQLREQLGVGSDCGKCCRCAKETLQASQPGKNLAEK